MTISILKETAAADATQLPFSNPPTQLSGLLPDNMI
jgi:hypothetical protein